MALEQPSLFSGGSLSVYESEMPSTVRSFSHVLRRNASLYGRFLSSNLDELGAQIASSELAVDREWEALFRAISTAWERDNQGSANVDIKIDRAVVEEIGTDIESDFSLDITNDDEFDRAINNCIGEFGQLAVEECLPSYQDVTTGQDDSSYDMTWLLLRCKNHLARLSQSGLNSFMDPYQLREDIMNILFRSQSDDHIQISLVELVGTDDITLLSDLIQHRQQLSNAARMENKKQLSLSEVPAIDASQKDTALIRRPQYGTSVTVTTEREKQEQKVLRKSQKANKTRGAQNSDFDYELNPDALRAAREYSLQTGPASLLPGHSSVPQVENYPHIYRASGTTNLTGSMLSLFGTRYALPVGTERFDEKDYEEIIIPAAKQSPPRTGESLVAIEDLESFARLAFPGYKTLNRMQSIVYPTAFMSNENMLICAPTGAGKTDVAMLAVLRTLSLYQRTEARGPHAFAIDAFKIIYVAPMKALAAEIVAKFSKRLAPLGISVRELTGDMQLSKHEIMSTQVIVTTPEKWDVVTRKSTGDNELAQKVRLLIIDEVHLLHEERGAVLETLVARTQRQVESSQNLIRIVGLSATLPNFIDVALFLRVNPHQGLFYFDNSFRPVPLEQRLIGIKGKTNSPSQRLTFNRVCHDKCTEQLRGGHQVMVFVHSRKETVGACRALIEIATTEDTLSLFDPQYIEGFGKAWTEVSKSRNRELKELFQKGFGIHHAGMLRSDRSLVERMFESGFIKVLCCTATLAWGINLPAHAVIIKGTSVYNAQRGAFVDLSILDVLQIFGRAGRPQYETHGVGYILTPHEKLSHYLSAITQQQPIESQFSGGLQDNLNAEISLGTVTTVDEAVQWLGYTYLYVRMKRNPMHYGIDYAELADDPLLGKRRRDLIESAAIALFRNGMIVFEPNTGLLSARDLGRIASNYYIKYPSVELFKTKLTPHMTSADVLALASQSFEFENIKLREEESRELKTLRETYCSLDVKGGTETHYGKVNILLQSYISHAPIDDFALVSDTAYVAQNAGRILRALFEMCLNRSWSVSTANILDLCKAVEKRLWSYFHPLSQFDLPQDILERLEKHDTLTVEELRTMSPNDIGQQIRNHKFGHAVWRCAQQFPLIEVTAKVAPITNTVLRVELELTPSFTWNNKVHGSVEPWWIWAEDYDQLEIYYSEYILITRKQSYDTIKVSFTIPVSDPPPAQVHVHVVSDRWLAAEISVPISFQHLILPEHHQPHTDLLDLEPLPVSALNNSMLEQICKQRFEFFNAIQTQTFFTLYHTQQNVLLGAPTGSGKTLAAELAMWKAFQDAPKSKVVYIAPLKALVRERVLDWRARLTGPMQRQLVELTGDITPDLKTIEAADIIITTPEKWDGVSRNWQTRTYIQEVSCVIIDEIHLLGGDRGPILEIIVSRMNHMSQKTGRRVRVVGLSTALANAHDLADWLGIHDIGRFNFRHSVRPVQLEIYIDGFPGKHYCPRMATMNKPAYAAIMQHSPDKPVIIFVSSRRQTRLTAQDLIAYCAMGDNPRRFLKLTENDLEEVLTQVKDTNLRHALTFGIGLHHAGLAESDRRIVEELFVNVKIQVLVATSTLAWGVNTPTHLVIVKGTEFFDAKTKKYIDFPITDVLQMMGRAGRPQFDDKGVACIFVQDTKKNFYKKFLHEPFPIESALHKHLHDHINAEIVASTIKTKQDAVDYLTWTYFFRRLRRNPAYYGAESGSMDDVSTYLSMCIERTIFDLSKAGCVSAVEDFQLEATELGRLASFYYLSYRTLELFQREVKRTSVFDDLLKVLCDAAEYDELPVRHNEDIHNKELSEYVPLPVDQAKFDCPHVKAHLLLQAHLSRIVVTISDYHTDTLSVLDQAVRILQALIDVAVVKGFLQTTLNAVNLLQCLKQGIWMYDETLLQLPDLETAMCEHLIWKDKRIESLMELFNISKRSDAEQLFKNVQPAISQTIINKILNVWANLPHLNVTGPNADNVLPTVSGNATDKSAKLRVKLTRRAPFGKNSRTNNDLKVHSPRFPKTQHEGWVVIIGDLQHDKVRGLKRISMRGPSGNAHIREIITADISVDLTGMSVGTHTWTLFVMSDAYVGLDYLVDVTVLIK